MDIADLLLLWFFSIVFIASLMGTKGVHIYKINAIYFVCLYFLILGLSLCFKMSGKENYLKVTMGVVGITYVCGFIQFTEYYFNHYVDDLFPNFYFEDTYVDAVQTMENNGNKEDTVYVDIEKDFDIAYFCASAFVAPYDYNFRDSFDEGYGEYQNYIMTTDMPSDLEANYIIMKKHKDYALDLEKKGYMVIESGDRFVCVHD